MSIPYDPEHITYFAETDYRNEKKRFGIKSRDRTRHMYVIGKSGVGKSTLLENMAIQDIQRGEGVAVLDPHGSFADKMLDYVPQERIKDVIYFAPFDTDHPISFNVLEDVGHDKRHLVASGLMSSFKKIWVDAWSARMEYILNNILLALLEYPEATLLGVNRMLSDKTFRNKVVENISDPSVKSFWTDEFAKYGERYMQEAGAAIQNKIGQFTANPLVRNIIGQPHSSFDIRQVMDEQKILIINLSKGRIGEQNTSLLGSMLITKIYLGAMSRAEVSSTRLGALPNFYFYVDEFQSFANETFADILAEARKYKLALIIAHQYVAQMEEKVRDAVFGNVGTTISFRVGPLDAELLEKVFSPQFKANDLINLGMAQIYLTLMINDMGSQPFSARTLPPLARPTILYRNDVIEYSRTAYAHLKDAVETGIREWYTKDAEQPEEKPARKVRFTDGQPPRAFSPKPAAQQQRFDRPQQEKAVQKVVERRVEKQPEQEPEHQPFQKAFHRLQDKPEVPEEPVQPSPGLKTLLNAFDFQEKKETPVQPIASKEPEKMERSEVPFVGEKPLREIVQPNAPKAPQRGPTEKNRELLRAVLGDVLKHEEKKEKPPISEQPQVKTEPDSMQQPAAAPQNIQQNKGEISTHDLKKILE